MPLLEVGGSFSCHSAHSTLSCHVTAWLTANFLFFIESVQLVKMHCRFINQTYTLLTYETFLLCSCHIVLDCRTTSLRMLVVMLKNDITGVFMPSVFICVSIFQ